jgi:hypothetical protein
MKKNTKKLTKEELKSICLMYEQGCNLNEIAAKHNIHRNSIHDMLKRQGIPLRSQTWRPKTIRNPEESVGKKFNKLTVIGTSNIRLHGHVCVVCKCECGNEKVVSLSDLYADKIKSCGCASKEKNSKKRMDYIRAMIVKSDPKIGSAKVVYKRVYGDGNLLFDDFLMLSQLNCFYCGAEPANRFNVYVYNNSHKTFSAERIRDGYFIYNGLDRVNNDLPHNKENVVPCCYPCNIAKLDRGQEEFIQWAKRVAKLHE